MSKFNEIAEKLEELNEDAILFDGYEDALVSIALRFNMQPVACYDIKKCIEILMNRDGMSQPEAVEWFEYNTLGAWVGEHTPIFINPL